METINLGQLVDVMETNKQISVISFETGLVLFSGFTHDLSDTGELLEAEVVKLSTRKDGNYSVYVTLYDEIVE